MTSSKPEANRQQMLVDNFFDSNATYWRDTYREKDILGIIYQRRQIMAINYVDSLFLPRTAKVLEIGCGAGLMTVALAKRGFMVEAVDHSQSMIDLTLELATQNGMKSRINAHTGDIHKLSFDDGSFDLIVALGVIPWLHDFHKALREIARALRLGGYVVLTMDNARRATTLFDPLTFPAVAQVIRTTRLKLEKAGLLSAKLWSNAPPYQQYSPREFLNSLSESGLTVTNTSSVGFGPFTFFGHHLFPEAIGIRINNKLQEYADNKYPILRSTGSQYIVLAAKK